MLRPIPFVLVGMTVVPLLVGPASRATAEVLCRKKSGAVFARAECKRKEVAVTLGGSSALQGPPGPQGPEGPRGPEGAPGTPADATLLPVAFGTVGFDATLYSGKNVSSVAYNLGRYEITLEGISYYFADYVTVVTSSGGVIAGTSSIGGQLLVFLNDRNGNPVTSFFSFVVYKP